MASFSCSYCVEVKKSVLAIALVHETLDVVCETVKSDGDIWAAGRELS